MFIKPLAKTFPSYTPKSNKKYHISRNILPNESYGELCTLFSESDKSRIVEALEKDNDVVVEIGKEVLLMPYFPLGSLAKYNWNKHNIHIFHTCIKHAVLSIISIFCKSHIIHGDFHPGNVLLKTTKQTELNYDLVGIGIISVPTYGMRPWIMDYVADFESSYDNFYYDVSKFFHLMPSILRNIDVRTIVPVTTCVQQLMMSSKLFTLNDVNAMLHHIDNIQFLQEK